MAEYNSEYKSLEKLPALRQQLQAPVASGGGDYDLIYLDFSDGAGLIQHNAMVLVELLEWINNPANRTTDAQETMVIAASMGGQVARFALAWMEQRSLCHNTRLYVSIDSPHRGANLPLGIQHQIDRVSSLPGGSTASKQVTYSLRRPATMQMLVYHYDDARAAPYRNQWQGWQNSADSYPSLLRKVAVANGSGNATFPPNTAPGMHLVHYFNTPAAGVSYAIPGITYNGHQRTVYWWQRYITVSGRVFYGTAPAGADNYDTAPGSSTDVPQQLGQQSGGSLVARTPTTTFMPTISTLDVHVSGPVMSPNFGYNVLANINPLRPDRSKYAFDAYYVPSTNVNEPHVQITNGLGSGQGNAPFLSDNAAWILNELRESSHELPALLASTYNFASRYRHYLPSVRVGSQGILYVNNNTLPASGGTPASQTTPAPSNFELNTSSCGSVVRVEQGGQLVLGRPGNAYTAEVNIGNKSLLDVQRGGTVVVEAGSILRLKRGSTFIVRNGGTLRVDGQVFIDDASLCFEQGANLQFSASSNLSIGHALPISLSVYDPGNLNCTDVVNVCGQFSSAIFGLYYNEPTANEALRFDGVDDVVSSPVTSPPSYVHGLDDEFTVEALIRPEVVGAQAASGNQIIYSTRQRDTNFQNRGLMLGLFTSSGTTWVLLQLNGVNYGYNQTGTLFPTDGRCHQIAVTRVRASNELKFYLDGQLTYTTTTARKAGGSGDVYLGADPYPGYLAEFFTGTMGELRVWNIARSDAELQLNLPIQPAPTPQAGLVTYYDMKDASNQQQLSDGSGVNLSNPSLPLVPGTLGETSAVEPSDPTWVTKCQLTCDVQGNYRPAIQVAGFGLPGKGPQARGSIATDTMSTGGNRAARASAAAAPATLSPNPATGQTTLHLELAKAATVRVRLLDLSGWPRKKLVSGQAVEAGRHDLVLPLQNIRPGLYLIGVDYGAGERMIRLELY